MHLWLVVEWGARAVADVNEQAGCENRVHDWMAFYD